MKFLAVLRRGRQHSLVAMKPQVFPIVDGLSLEFDIAATRLRRNQGWDKGAKMCLAAIPHAFCTREIFSIKQIFG